MARTKDLRLHYKEGRWSEEDKELALWVERLWNAVLSSLGESRRMRINTDETTLKWKGIDNE